MIKRITIVFVINLFLVFANFGQNQVSIEEILSQSQQQTANYQETFRNLIALETKTFEEYKSDAELKKQTVVEADFLVYQSSKNPKLSFELRNVLRVNTKPIPNSQANADKFFAELRKTSTLKSELEKIQRTSSKYDKTFDVSGLTLYEGIVLSDNLRPFFEYQLQGQENFQGRHVLVVNYWQTKETPFISINGKETDPNNPSLEFQVEMPGDVKKSEFFLRGKFWIDAENFQIWREERELVAQGEDLLVLLKTNLEYQPSNFGILVPKQITLLSNEIKKKDGKFIAVLDSKVIFDYSKFKKTETDVKILDDTEK